MIVTIPVAVLVLALLHESSCQVMMGETGQPGSMDPFIEPAVLTPEQAQLNQLCNERCKTELCYLADDGDCRKFITCQQDGQGTYHATRQPCAFGTYWGGLQKQKKITCDLPENVICQIDYCSGLNVGDKYDHVDGNCKTYWECDETLNPVARCCPDGYYFDALRRACIVDDMGTCNDRCLIKNDACSFTGQLAAFFDDRNCRTYWDCEDRHPHPVCCRAGEGFDPEVSSCVTMPSCVQECPPQYEPDACQKGISKYSLLDGSCRTYMKCNVLQGDERWCCPSNYVFDAMTESCIRKTPDMDLTCDDSCPSNYSEECHLGVIPEDPASFLAPVQNGPPMPRPCAPGTLFDLSKCGCGLFVEGAPDNSCNMELDITFDRPQWINEGSQKMTKLTKIGVEQYGPTLGGRTSYKFDGDLYYRFPFFQSQYPNVYINVIYNPEPTVGTGRRVLLSNCMNTDLGGPTLELYLENNRIFLSLVSDAIIQNVSDVVKLPVVIDVDYSPGSWNTYTAIYNGQDVFVLNEGAGAPSFNRKPLTGDISVPAEGLDIGGCVLNRMRNEGFVGSVAKVQFSKCLRQEWIDKFNEATVSLQP